MNIDVPYRVQEVSLDPYIYDLFMYGAVVGGIILFVIMTVTEFCEGKMSSRGWGFYRHLCWIGTCIAMALAAPFSLYMIARQLIIAGVLPGMPTIIQDIPVTPLGYPALQLRMVPEGNPAYINWVIIFFFVAYILCPWLVMCQIHRKENRRPGAQDSTNVVRL